MKYLTSIIFLAVLLASCIKSSPQISYAKGYNVNTPVKFILLFSGESNAGGQALNSAASAAEKAPRNINILNNYKLIWEPLDIGYNNLMLHYDINETDYHGWELQFANQVDSGTFRDAPMYIVKTGQGSSTINMWAEGGGSGKFLWDTLQKRLDTAIVLLRGLNKGATPPIFMFYSQGINDRVSSVPVATWKAATKAHFTKIRAKYGTVPIFITYLPTLNNGVFNTAITEIASEMTEIYPIATSDATLSGAHHWDYSGMKLIARRMIASFLTNYYWVR